ncbi:MAG TPA: cytochrome b/b6 domain-containing protein, partial [Agromyces mariniharenae]|nr:cytochrome b/b6 domain-containing protein [Agromyces mariniharenae]
MSAAPAVAIAEAPVASTTAAPAASAAPASGRRLRSGLPRVAGGRPWPEAGGATVAEKVGVTDAAAVP